MNRTRIVFAGAAPDAEPTYLILDELGSVVGRGILPVQEASALTPMRNVLVVPGADVLIRWVSVKAASEAQARAAALAQLEDQMTSPAGAHLALAPAEADGQRLAAVVAAARMQAWLDGAALHGIAPDLVIPDCLALPEPSEDPDGASILATAEFGGLTAVRGRRLAFTGEPDLVAAVVGDRPAQTLAGPVLERALADMAVSPALTLLQGAFDPGGVAHEQRGGIYDHFAAALLPHHQHPVAEVLKTDHGIVGEDAIIGGHPAIEGQLDGAAAGGSGDVIEHILIEFGDFEIHPVVRRIPVERQETVGSGQGCDGAGECARGAGGHIRRCRLGPCLSRQG